MIDSASEVAANPNGLPLREAIRAELVERGWMSLARYMELALYTPLSGYYTGGAQKFGEAGDFVTAPEISPIFGQTLAAQVAQILTASAPVVLEFGAGTGKLATDLFQGLSEQGCPPDRYFIVELSGELRARQQDRIQRLAPDLAHSVRWLDSLPPEFSGCVLANEVLDAMPVHLVSWRPDGLFERGVCLGAQDEFEWQERPAIGHLRDAAAALPPRFPYVSEVSLAAPAWIREWRRRLDRGALLLIDYGFPRHEYYHPQRSTGTLMCHYRHRSHSDPFFLPGLSDITAHVDFSAIADAARDSGLDLLGYTSQAHFLINCGLTRNLGRVGDPNSTDYLRAVSGVQKLVSPAEMGELFKVMAVGRGIGPDLVGFRQGDRRHTLG